MSLQNLATQMAAQGRGPDRTLVHMSPKEVQGLQALAMAHGGSLTINPETGLPEAGFLENILPAVAGFALDAFLPGAGEALGGIFGLEGAAASQVGSALAVGGISGLASGSLEKGIMAGMGAYGGAGLSQSLGNMGAGVNARAANASFDGTDPTLTDTERVAAIQAASKPDIGAGFSAAAKAPMDFLKDNKMSLAMLAAPILMDSFGNKDSGPEANPSPGYIRTMKRDPVTGRIYQESAIPTGEFGNRSVGTYGGVPARGMADGGIVEPNAQVAYDTRTDSQKALAYLMGEQGSTNPMMFTRPANTEAIKPADMLTRTGGHYVLDAATNTYTWLPDAAAAAPADLAALDNQNRGGGREVNQADKDRINNLFDSYASQDKVFGLPPGTTASEARSKDLASAAKFIMSPLSSIYSFAKDAFTPMQPKSMSEIGPFKDIHPDDNDAGMVDSNGNPVGSTTPTTTTDGLTTRSMAPPSDAPSGGSAEGAAARGGNGFGGTGSGVGGLGEGSGGGRYAASGGLMEARYASGGLGSLGGYSDGGQLLKGPGDGVSDSIPAKIAGNQPARLADGEFVIPARIVSELGNGSTNAGAKQLYKMLDRIQANRKKTVGKNKTATDSKSARYLPA